MTFVIIGIAALFLWLFPALRCAVTHPFHCLYYAAKDGYKYIKYKQGNLRKTGNLDIFCGYFGNGKTLSLVKQVVCREYKRFDGLQVWCNRRQKFVTQRILILSNVDLCVPYEPLTGLAQVSGRNNISWEEKLAYDQEYVKHITFLGDLRIILKTIGNVLKKEDINTDGMATAEDFGDYLLRTGQVDQETYDRKQRIARRICEKNS